MKNETKYFAEVPHNDGPSSKWPDTYIECVRLAQSTKGRVLSQRPKDKGDFFVVHDFTK